MAAPVAQLYVDLRAGVARFTQDLQQATKTLRSTEAQFKSLGTRMSLAISAPLAGIAGASLKAFAQFETELVRIGQKTNATAGEMDQLKAAVLDFAAKTPYSTKQVAEGMKELAATGFDTTQILAAMPGILGMATVAEIDVGQAAKYTATILKQFGMQAADSTVVSDTLAKAADLSAISVEDLALSFKYAGTNADLAGVPFKEVAAALAIMGNKGIAADTAGTNLRMGFARLLKPTKQVHDALAELNVPLTDLTNENGTLKPLPVILDRLNAAGIKSAQVFKIFGIEAAGGWAALLKSGAPALTEIVGKLDSATGYTEQFNAKLKETLSFKWETMTGGLNALATAIGEALAPAAKAALDLLASLFDKLTGLAQGFLLLDAPTRAFVITLGTVAVAAGPVLYGLGTLVGILGLLVSPLVLVGAKIGLVAAGLVWMYESVRSEEFAAGLGVIKDAFLAAFKYMSDTMDAFGQAGADFWNVTFPGWIATANQKLDELWTAITTFATNAVNAIVDMVTGITSAIIDKLYGVLDGLKQKLSDVGDWFAGLYDDVVGHSYVPDMVEEIGAWFKKLKPSMVDYSKMVCTATADNFAEMGGQVGEVMSRIGDDVKKGTKGISDALSGAGGGTGNGSLIDTIFGSLSGGKEGGGGPLDGLASTLGNGIGDAINAALQGGSVRDAIANAGGQIGSQLGTAIGASIGGPLGAAAGNAIGSVLGKQVQEDIKNFGKDAKSTFKGIVDVMFGFGTGMVADKLFGNLFGGGNADTEARKKIEGFLENALKGKHFQIFDSKGTLKDLDNIIFGSSKRFNDPKWTSGFDKLSESAKTTFQGLGEGLKAVLGITEDVGGQIGLILAENLLGNVDNARLLVQTLGVSFEDMQTALVNAGLQGEMSWHAVEVALQGVSEAYKPGLAAVGDYVGAFNELINSGGKGAGAIKGVKDIAVEAMQAGATSLQDLQARLSASGQFTEQQITALFTALSQRGITSLQQLADVQDRVGGGIVADMESLGIVWGQVDSKIQGVKDTLDSIPQDSTRNLEFNVTTNLDGNTQAAMDGGVFSAGGVAKTASPIPAFAKGGIVNGSTLFKSGRKLGLMGEAGPEAIMPLQRVGGRLGVAATGGTGGGTIIHIDARHAAAGVEHEIRRALDEAIPQIVEAAAYRVTDKKSRGGSYGSSFE